MIVSPLPPPRSSPNTPLQLLARAKRPHGRREARTDGTNWLKARPRTLVGHSTSAARVSANVLRFFVRVGDFRSQFDDETRKFQKMSVSMFNKKYDFNTTIKADDNERESKFLDSVKDLWMSCSVAYQNLQEAKYYLKGCRRSANESGTWAGRFDTFEPEENDSDYGEYLESEEEVEEGEEAVAT